MQISWYGWFSFEYACRLVGVGGLASSIGAVFGVDSFPSSVCADLSVWVVFLRGPLGVGSFPSSIRAVFGVGLFSFEYRCRPLGVGGFPSSIDADLLVWVVFLSSMCAVLGVGSFPSSICADLFKCGWFFLRV